MSMYDPSGKTADASAQSYDYILKLVRECGQYPIRLTAEFEQSL